MSRRQAHALIVLSEPLMRRRLRRREQGGEGFHPRHYAVIGVMAVGTGVDAFMPVSAGSLGRCMPIDSDALLSFV